MRTKNEVYQKLKEYLASYVLYVNFGETVGPSSQTESSRNFVPTTK